MGNDMKKCPKCQKTYPDYADTCPKCEIDFDTGRLTYSVDSINFLHLKRVNKELAASFKIFFGGLLGGLAILFLSASFNSGLLTLIFLIILFGFFLLMITEIRGRTGAVFKAMGDKDDSNVYFIWVFPHIAAFKAHKKAGKILKNIQEDIDGTLGN